MVTESEAIQPLVLKAEKLLAKAYRRAMAEATANVTERLEKEYARGYSEGLDCGLVSNGTFDSGYEAGCNDVWDLAYRLYAVMTTNNVAEAMGVDSISFSEILRDMSPAEVMAKLKAWDDKKAKEITESPTLCGYKDLSVGEEVQDCSDCIGVITNIDTAIHVLYKNGKTHKWGKNTKFLKTGQHVANIWEWMG